MVARHILLVSFHDMIALVMRPCNLPVAVREEGAKGWCSLLKMRPFVRSDQDRMPRQLLCEFYPIEAAWLAANITVVDRRSEGRCNKGGEEEDNAKSQSNRFVLSSGLDRR